MSLHSSLTRMLCTLLLPTPILAWQPVDLYPREAIGEISKPDASKPDAIQRGCVLLEQVLQKSFANQQPATTDRAAVLHIDLRDDWHGVNPEHIPPWPPTDQRLQLRFAPRSTHGEIEFANGRLHKRYGASRASGREVGDTMYGRALRAMPAALKSPAKSKKKHLLSTRIARCRAIRA